MVFKRNMIKKEITDQTEKHNTTEKRNTDKLISILNKYSLLFHILLSCGICFLIEWISRHSFLEACGFVLDRNLVFLYNSLIVFSSLTVVYIAKRRAVLRTLICFFWLFLGIINGCILAKRVSPFSFTDLKMVGDLFTMQSNYFTATEAVIVIVGVSAVIFLLIVLWFKGPKFEGRQHRIMSYAMLLAVAMMLPNVTSAAVSSNILTSYFENLAQGYKDYGFVYSFSASVLDRGMSKPENYSADAVNEVLQKINSGKSAAASLEAAEPVKTASSETVESGSAVIDQVKNIAMFGKSDTETYDEQMQENEEIPEDADKTDFQYPNIICILLESFVDPEEIRFLSTSEDPIPNFHALFEKYSSGYLEVPVVGAGTANTEFEVLTGMGMQFFGLGEYPYKTILKKTNCESIASDLRTLGYGSHAVHDNGGNFYSRKNAFSMMGFDTFTCKEMMDIRKYTPLGTWPQDDIMIGEVEKSLDYTPDQPDFVYTITVESHGDYPKEQVLKHPKIQVTSTADDGLEYAWEYYVNQIYQVDDFVGQLIDMLEKRGEPTVVVMFGDHLPTMGLTEEDMKSGSVFLTKYATWDNIGLEKQDKDMTSYQFLADMLDKLDIHIGTMFQFHQNRNQYADPEEYQRDMKLLQYDILYGDHYVYGGENPYPATEIEMGTQDVEINHIFKIGDNYFIYGKNFTKWSKVYVDGKKISTSYQSSGRLRVKSDKISEEEHTFTVCQVGSSDTIFRSSNEYIYLPKKE